MHALKKESGGPKNISPTVKKKKNKEKIKEDGKKNKTKLFGRKLKEKSENSDVSFDDVQVVFVTRPTEPKKVEEELSCSGAPESEDDHEDESSGVIENVLLEKTADGGVRIRINRIQTEEDKLQAAQNKMREHVFRELVNTEKSYYENLATIEKGLCQLTTKVLTDEEQKFAFSNIPTLVTAHATFFQILKKNLQTWSSNTLVGDIFIKNANFVPDYECYLTNYVTSLVYVFA